MAIFPEYAMPKYKSPIRITRPYIKPNYLADAIVGGIGAYTNMQGMNLKKQMFMAQMAERQRQVQEQNDRQAAFSQLAQQRSVVDPLMVAGPHADNTQMMAHPGGKDDLWSAISHLGQAGYNPQQAISIGQAMFPQAKQPNALSHSNLLAQEKWKHRLATDAKKADEALFTEASNMVGEALGKPLKDDFKYKDFVMLNEDYQGAAAQEEYLKNIEWQGLQGVQAYQKMIMDTTQHVYELLKSGQINKQQAKLWLLQMSSTSRGNPLEDIDDELKRARTPTIPAALQKHIDDLKESNTSRRNTLPTPGS